jgi:hypothetical protein
MLGMPTDRPLPTQGKDRPMRSRVARAGSHDGTRMGGWTSWPGCVHAHGG